MYWNQVNQDQYVTDANYMEVVLIDYSLKFLSIILS